MANKNKKFLSVEESATILILQFIKIELLEEKARIQRKGAAIEELDTGDEPQESEYIPDKVQAKGTITFNEFFEQQVNEPSPVEELIKKAENITSGTSPTDKIQLPPKKPASLRARWCAWFTAWTAWKVRKQKFEYEYERIKTDVVNMCYGIDFAIKLIDREIERQRSGDAIKVGDRFLCQG